MKRKNTLVALLCTAGLMLALTACGGTSNNYNDYAYDAQDNDISYGGEYGGEEQESDADSEWDTKEVAGRVMTYSASISLDTTDLSAAQTSLQALVSSSGGYVSEAYQSKSDTMTGGRVEYTIKVPAENYSAFMASLQKLGTVNTLQESAQDITNDVIDVNARLTALQQQRDRLLQMASEATTTEELLKIENQLAEVQYSIESYTGEQRTLQEQVRYSAVDVTLREVTVETPKASSFGSQMSAAFQSGWRMLINGLQQALLMLAFCWPLLVLVAVGLLVWFCVWLLSKKHTKPAPQVPNKKVTQNQQPPTSGR